MQSFRTSDHHNWYRMPGEHPKGDKFQAVLFVGFLSVWFLDSILNYTTWLNSYIPLSYRLSVGIFCIILSYSIIRQSETDLFNRPGDYKYPVYHGIYRYCRHPMYLGDLIFHIGFGILSISIAAWFLIGVSILLYSYLCHYEERALIRVYGEKYLLYMKTVPRWFPKIKFFVSHPNLEQNIYQE